MVVKEAGRLPAFSIAAEVNDALDRNGTVIVTAPPGAGKSTVLPLTISGILPSTQTQSGVTPHTHTISDIEPGQNDSPRNKPIRKVLMLEPRRIAAIQIAQRMSEILNEPVGKTVGYRVRFDSKISADTIIEIVTEGVMTRMLVEDPGLMDTDVVIFDEFHERSLQTDVTLAMVREARDTLRDDLKIVIMSATMNCEELKDTLNAEVVESEGRIYDVKIVQSKKDTEKDNIAIDVANAIRTAPKDGSVLAFLPGEAEIRECCERLSTIEDTDIFPLYGMLSTDEQRKAIAPGTRRKIVLATPIAETSLTIEGITTVIDSGWCRKNVFDPQSGLSRMETVRISRDMAKQRAGRAGRLSEGTCYRLWSEATDRRMAESRIPEILEADLAGMVLEIAAWGGGSAASLKWITEPPQTGIKEAGKLLQGLGAIDDKGLVTAHGRRLAALPCHPRIANMLTKSAGALATDLAAVLEERQCADLCETIRLLRCGRLTRRAERAATQYRRLIHAKPATGPVNPYEIGALLAAAFPERVAKATPEGCGHFILANGALSFLEHTDPLFSSTWLSVASLNSVPGKEGRIFLAAPLDPEDVPELMRVRDHLGWDSREGRIVARREWRIGGLLVKAMEGLEFPKEMAEEAICRAVCKEGVQILDFNDEVAALQRRIGNLAQWRPELGLPDVSTGALLAAPDIWLKPFIGKARTVQELKRIRLCDAILSMLDYGQQCALDRLAPSYVTVPTGSRIRLDYRQGSQVPVLRVRLQECFGLLDTPCVDDGRKPVLMELLSPGFKPVQLTSDLRSFWSDAYFEVRKELRRRYPKHS